MDDAVDLVDTLLAIDFSTDYAGVCRPASAVTAPLVPRPLPVQAPPARDGTRSVNSTPPRPGAGVQAGRAACKKISSALAVTEVAVISTHMKNQKAKTPPQHRYAPQHRPPESGCITFRDLRRQAQSSPVANQQPQQQRFRTGCPGAGPASGSVTARGPRALPFSNLRASADSANLRPLLTARPSRAQAGPAIGSQHGPISARNRLSNSGSGTTQPPTSSRPTSSSSSRLGRSTSLSRPGSAGSPIQEEPQGEDERPQPVPRLSISKGSGGGGPPSAVPLSPRTQLLGGPTTARPPWRSGNSSGGVASPRRVSVAVATGITPPCDPSTSNKPAVDKAAGVGLSKAAGLVPKLSLGVAGRRVGLPTDRGDEPRRSTSTNSNRSSSSDSSGGGLGSRRGLRAAPLAPGADAAGARSKPTPRLGPVVPGLKLGGHIR